ncbi:MAG: M28 family metallopeptidase [Treponema sp.]|nr:M28 family metallopeptidase [Treponema sp.]MCL2272021.1 M28 family metallopeptidase [Treponema sp.]
MKTEASGNDWIKQSPYDRFNYFIAIKVDRYKTLLATVEKLRLNSLAVSISGNRHFLIFPPSRKLPRPLGSALPFAGQSPFMLVAHYDRVDGSPGANDNSIAVFHLLKAANILTQRGLSNWMIVFTDKEELTSGENFESQGSFTLAQKLRVWGLEKAKIFNFDACGTGDTLIFSNLTDSVLNNNDRPNIQKIKSDVQQLRNHALNTASLMHLEKFLIAPAPFCDDMGFLRAGFAVQTVTMLPSEEASAFEEILRKYPEFTKLLISGEIKKSNERRNLPSTWKNLNTVADTPDRLTPQNFNTIVNFVVELCSN